MPPVAALVFALLGISLAAPLVRLSTAHPLVIGLWRLGFSLIVVGAALVVSGTWREWRRLAQADVAVAVAAGVMLALHFWSWNASVGLTTIAASTTLVNLMPVFVAVLSARWLNERPTRRQVAGIAAAMLGAGIVAAPDLLRAGAVGGGRALLGDLLAVGGAATAAVYYVAGRRLRTAVGLWPYVGLVYGACFVTLLALVVGLDLPVWPQPRRELAIFAGLALGPMLLGHTGMNYALRYLPAYVVNLTVLGEPVGATLIAMLLPGIGETPGPATLLGGAVLLAGVVIASRR